MVFRCPFYHDRIASSRGHLTITGDPEAQRISQHMEVVVVNNLIVRTKLLETGLRTWKLADILNVSEPTIYRKLRKELSAEEQNRICRLIDEYVAKEAGKNEAD